MTRLGLALLFVALTVVAPSAASFDAGHVIITAREPGGGPPGFEEVDLSGSIVEDGIRMSGGLQWLPEYGESFHGDGPFWDLHVQAKEGFVLGAVSITGQQIGRGGITILSDTFGEPGSIDSPFGFVLFPPTTEASMSLLGGVFVDAESPVAFYDVVIRFHTAAVPEPGTVALVAGATVVMLAMRTRRV
jgi:hypothetical protein